MTLADAAVRDDPGALRETLKEFEASVKASTLSDKDRMSIHAGRASGRRPLRRPVPGEVCRR
ncbi:hypothetical protein [Roseicella aquatilis]|uniref:hypothetical protein n=1 Tax=Roseicella aquatilis TaxID=2527868 RepID=UPI001404CA1A|nr:hypothetical protein [Roseicella aquatilis]